MRFSNSWPVLAFLMHIGIAGCGTDESWGDGPRTVSGQVHFFDLQGLLTISENVDVVGAEVYVVEAPYLRMEVGPEDGQAFSFSGIPDGVEVTLAVVHEAYYPHMTATMLVDGEDIEGVDFQAVSHRLAGVASGLVGIDINEPGRCHMATTVSAAGAMNIWAPGEPGATVTLDPPVPVENGPFYFNASVRPDRSLTETSTDGGVLVSGAVPGIYTWTAHKPGVEFSQLKMRCEEGFITNAVPPLGMNVIVSSP